MSFTFWRRWLEIGFLGFILFGLAFAVLGTASVFAPLFAPVLSAFWVDGAIPVDAQGFAMLAFGIAGALTAALGELGWFVTRHALARRERWAWTALAASLTLWFLVDGAMSIASGAALNVAFNAIFFLLIAIPLAGAWPHLRARETAPDAGARPASA